MCRLHRHSSSLLSNTTATSEINPLSLHDALPICEVPVGHLPNVFQELLGEQANVGLVQAAQGEDIGHALGDQGIVQDLPRSEEHTSELQSRPHIVCRLLLDKKESIVTTDRISLNV